MNELIAGEIHYLVFETNQSIDEIDALSDAKEKLNALRALCRKVAAECDEIERKLIEDDE